MTEYSFAGVHLRPNNPFYYQQRTYANNGIEIEEVNSAIIRDICGNQLADIQDYFEVAHNFQDEDTGLPQIYWKIKQECPFDFGYQLVYLEINSGANAVVYSSPFMFTEHRAEYTSIWYYKNNSDTYICSIGLQFYYRQKKSDTTLTTYTPLSTGVQYTSAIKLLKFERWNTDVLEIGLIELLKYIFDCNVVYSKPENFDGYPVLTSLKEAVETPDLEADENFAEAEVLLIRDYSNAFDPYAVPVTPPVPTPQDPYINLVVERIDNQNVRYVFDYGNFNPTELTLQRSLSTEFLYAGYTFSPPTSPRTYGAPDNHVNNYYYRVYHFGTDTASNVVQLPQRSIIIDSIVFSGTPNIWSIGYTINGFTIPQGRLLTFQSSNDGLNWYKTVTDANNNNPKLVQVAESIPPMDRIRILYETENIISNTIMLPS